MMRNVPDESVVLDTEALSLLARGRSDDTLALVQAVGKAWAPSLLITGDVEDLCLLTEGSDVKVISV